MKDQLGIHQKSNYLFTLEDYFVKKPFKGIVFVDSFGVLEAIYAQSGMCISAGSFNPVYKGHNLLEAAPYNVLLVTGAFNESSKELLSELQSKKACIVVKDTKSLSSVVSQFLKEPNIYSNEIRNYKSEVESFHCASTLLFNAVKDVRI